MIKKIGAYNDEILFNNKKIEMLLPETTQVKLENVVLSKITQAQKHKCCMILHMQNFKKLISEWRVECYYQNVVI